jgi:hypothetical protein
MYASFVVFIFSATSVVFVFYDLMVQRRQKTVMKSALASNALIANMFPENVREKLLLNAEEQANKKGESSKQGSTFAFGARKQLTSFLDEIHQEKDENASLFPTLSTKPIADLFTHATVMFADIAGFTGMQCFATSMQNSMCDCLSPYRSLRLCSLRFPAWSSIREPSQGTKFTRTMHR